MNIRENIKNIIEDDMNRCTESGMEEAIIKFINTTYQPLVDAAGESIRCDSIQTSLLTAYQPFIPPPKLSEELDELSRLNTLGIHYMNKISKLADRAREMEGKL
jgi:hypothetical protein